MPNKAKKGWLAILNMNLRWFLLAMIMANIAGQMVYSLLSLYLLELGASVGQVGLVFTIASLVPMALQIFGGWLSDTIGRLRAIALGSSIAVFGYLLFLVSPSWQWVLLGLCIEFVSNSFVGPSFSAYIAEQALESERGRVFGLSKSIYMVVAVIGPGLAGFLAYRFSFRLMLLVALVLYFGATSVRFWMATAQRFAPTRQAEKPTLSGLRIQVGAMLGLLLTGGILTWIWITDAIGDTAFNLIYQLYPIYLSEIGKLNLEQIGWLNSGWGLASILASLVAGWLTDRTSERKVIVTGFFFEGVGLFLLLQAQSFPLFMAAMFIFGYGTGSLVPAYDTLISKIVPEERRGLAFGLFGTSLGLLSLPFPWIGAQLWERFNPQLPFWLTVAACLISMPIAWFKFILPERQAEEAN
ncbi:MAG: MFS transporter [Anaerolineales bacterium]|nr:MAG: MFS transporter [Anaerolineales bacterium]